jgi:hypothetical protein
MVWAAQDTLAQDECDERITAPGTIFGTVSEAP